MYAKNEYERFIHDSKTNKFGETLSIVLKSRELGEYSNF